MCGIVGAVDRSTSVLKSQDIFKFFEQALFADTVRGKHGTGIMAIDNAGNLEYYKRGLAAPDFLELPKTKEILADKSNIFLVGHNRFATHGSHTCVNTHPFQHSHITLVHNGGISNFRSLVAPAKFEVDSEAIAYAFSIKDPKDVLEELEGAYSLVWYDSVTESLNFARNEERPMWFGTIKDSDSLIFGSEPTMLRWLANRNDINVNKMTELEKGKWLQLPLSEKEGPTATVFTPKPKTVSTYYQGYTGKRSTGVVVGISDNIENFKYSYVTKEPEVEAIALNWEAFNSNNSWGKINCTAKDGKLKLIVTSFNKEEAAPLLGKKIIVKVNSVTKEDIGYASFIRVKTEKKQSHFIDSPTGVKWVLGPKQRYITNTEFTYLCQDGCKTCGKDIKAEDSVDLAWSGEDPICASCQEYTDYLIETNSRAI